ncbi:unnamed protein product [Thlaspi arvense]|uniref:Wax synthase domain-containing protein n=1 Tax=Thlaspi arvense TaxID=13288 RepID=A0AAU9RUN2_THLAR|nr:unnamed protein product [Thlaspi arvense]
MVTASLWSTVYSPVRTLCRRFVNSEWASFIGVLATFIVSGLGHEATFACLTREPPTGEVTLFFVLHGVCVGVEVLVKKKTSVGRWPVRQVVSRLLTVGFLCVTSGWLVFPQLNHVMERSASEALLVVDFFKRKLYDHGNKMLRLQNPFEILVGSLYLCIPYDHSVHFVRFVATGYVYVGRSAYFYSSICAKVSKLVVYKTKNLIELVVCKPVAVIVMKWRNQLTVVAEIL